MSDIIYFSNDVIGVLCTFSTVFCTLSIEYILKLGNTPLFDQENSPRNCNHCACSIFLLNQSLYFNDVILFIISLQFICFTNAVPEVIS